MRSLALNRYLQKVIIFGKLNPIIDPIKLQAGVYFMNYIKKLLKQRVLENSELHFVSENLIRLLTMKHVQIGIKYQL